VKHGKMTGMPAKDTIKLTEKVIQFTDAGEVTGNLSGILLQVMIRPGVKPVTRVWMRPHHVQGGYSVPLIITASDITSHQSVSRKISARHFAGIFQWLTGIRTENIPPFNLLTDEDNEPIMVFNGERN
ncbi:hypothetical protein ACD968_25245, partial [Escherichia coli]